MKLKNFINAVERNAIENAVRDAETHTSGEIVPVVVEKSSRYDWVGYQSALVGWACAFAITVWMHYQRPFAFGFWETQAAQVIGLALGWAISRIPVTMRFLAGPHAMAEEVLHAAQGSFLKNGLVNTRDRTGVLVFVSLHERRVQILADRGIHEKVGDEFWESEVDKIVDSIRNGRAADGLSNSIRSIGMKLQAHFPRKADDTNELPDRLRTE